MTTENALINAEKAWKRCNAAGVRFVNLALDTGLMFCRIALLSESEHDARRDEAKANSAYQIARSTMRHLWFSPPKNAMRSTTRSSG
jgi:hypothetical protein